MANKEQNFISAVIYSDSSTTGLVEFLESLNSIFESRFMNFEFIVVNNNGSEKTLKAAREWAKSINKPLTFIHMSMVQSLEMCMNAGIDCAIGDYVYEFDTTDFKNAQIIMQAYDTAMKGNDIVAVSPSESSFLSNCFYSIFNKNSKSEHEIQTDLFRLVSRRAVNRVHASSSYLPFRKAAYASSGLKAARIIFDGSGVKSVSTDKFSLALDSLALYTDAGFKISIRFAIIMMLIAVLELVYTLIVFFTGHPIEGWTTMMFVLTIGFAGLFSTSAIIIKYLSLILGIVFSKQKYRIEGIEKIQK